MAVKEGNFQIAKFLCEEEADVNREENKIEIEQEDKKEEEKEEKKEQHEKNEKNVEMKLLKIKQDKELIIPKKNFK